MRQWINAAQISMSVKSEMVAINQKKICLFHDALFNNSTVHALGSTFTAMNADKLMRA